jgi:uncharacterized protein (TIGR02147 family)
MNIFSHKDYRDLINDLLEDKLGRGSKVRLAEELNCQPGYISQVLTKSKIHFSPENIIRVAAFLELSSVESEYLLNLLHKERAGSKPLREFYEKKILGMQEDNSKVEKQVKNTNLELDEEAKAVYYSHWAYSAIHMIVSIGEYQKPELIAKKLRLNLEFTQKILQFLVKKQLVTKQESKFVIGKTRIHLKSDSPLVKSHHQNYRQKAINSLEEENSFDLHYSSVLTLSKKDSLKIRELVLKLIADKEKILIPSANEEIIFLNLDLFR